MMISNALDPKPRYKGLIVKCNTILEMIGNNVPQQIDAKAHFGVNHPGLKTASDKGTNTPAPRRIIERKFSSKIVAFKYKYEK